MLALTTLTVSVTLIGSDAALGQEYQAGEQVKAELAGANRDGTILSRDGRLWRDLGALRHHTSGRPIMGVTNRSPDMAAGKN